MKIHFVVASEQVIQNIIPIMMDPPDEVHIAVNEEIKSSLSLENLKRFIKNKVSVKYLIKSNFPSSVAEVSNWVEQYLSSPKLRDAELTVNLTGGTKQMALGIYRALSKSAPKAQAIYVNTLSGCVEFVPLDDTTPPKIKESIPEGLLSIQLQFYAYGHDMHSSYSSHNNLISDRKSLTKNFLEESHRNGHNLVKAINSVASRYSGEISSSNYSSFSFVFNKEEIDRRRWSDLLDQIVTAGLVGYNIDGGLYKYVPKSYEAYLYLAGGWLEEYCYNVVASLPGFEVIRNVIITSIQDDKVPNELDVVIGHNNRMAIIECKASSDEKIINNAIYKLNSLSRVLGGSLVTKILVCPMAKQSDQRSSEHGIIMINNLDDVIHLGDRLKNLL